MNNKVKNILISNGPTRVYLDPVRYISNISSGKMGLAFVKNALKQNLNVCVISGKVDFKYPKHKNLEIINIETNDEMLNELEKRFDWANVFISVSAVVDFEPIFRVSQKIKKSKNGLVLKLKNSIDILKTLAIRKKSSQIIVGFALETEDLLKNAEKKLKEKNLDFIIANKLEDSMGLDTAKAILISKTGDKIFFDKIKKEKLTKEILKKILEKEE